jgi:hypothetical protein
VELWNVDVQHHFVRLILFFLLLVEAIKLVDGGPVLDQQADLSSQQAKKANEECKGKQ